jgi:23S rRNA-/tRNA-specific pseudouridylate synthase
MMGNVPCHRSISILLVISCYNLLFEGKLLNFALTHPVGIRYKLPSASNCVPRSPDPSRRVNGQLRQRISTELAVKHDRETIISHQSCSDVSQEPFVDLPPGLPNGFFVVKEYSFTPCNDTGKLPVLLNEMNNNHVKQLGLSLHNVTVPLALAMIDPETYPSLSRARKACRKGSILIVRQCGMNSNESHKFIGRVGDRVYTGDKICVQVRMGDGYFSALGHRKPPFELPVVYQDDHFALINKPAGIVCYRQGSGEVGLLSVRAALPFVLEPPRRGTYSVLRRPASVHRLDKPTSGLLCIVKTKPALISLSRQFHDRIVQKTYVAIINGIPEENSDTSISSEEAVALGVDIDLKSHDDTRWQVIDSPLDDKHAITIWRAVRYVPSLRARDGFLTLVELKPKTGRYHQLRRHMTWNAQRTIVGDTVYDGGHPDAKSFRGSGLFLCASGISLEHPFYNTVDGRIAWNNMNQGEKGSNSIVVHSTSNDKVMVSATIDLPNKFLRLLEREEQRYLSLKDATTVQ